MILLLLGCSIQPAPEILAIRACDAMPGLSLDSAGLAMTTGVIVDDERTLWADHIAQGAGFERIGLSGYGVIRANLSCVLQSIDSDSVQLQRIEPDITQLSPWENTAVWELPSRTVTLDYGLEQTPDGVRVRTGLASALEQAQQARSLHEQGQSDQAIATWETLYTSYPDPMIHFEILEIQRQQALQQRDQTLEGPDGPVKLSALAGPVTLLVRTEPACPDCQVLASTVATLTQDHPGLRVIWLSETPERLEGLTRYAMAQPPDPDPLPIFTLLDARYEATWRWTGFDPQDSVDLRASLDAAIQSSLP